MLHEGHRRELSGGYRATTNNRMEILGVLEALRTLKEPCSVTVRCDSEYVVRAMREGWPQKWQQKGWMRTKKDAAANPDLWDALLKECVRHEVEFVWVRGHAGNRENERCDRLAVAASRERNLPVDEGYEDPKGVRSALLGDGLLPS
jgi:ribonuclease HI